VCGAPRRPTPRGAATVVHRRGFPCASGSARAPSSSGDSSRVPSRLARAADSAIASPSAAPTRPR
jgi:hypothetical protein